MFRMSLLTVVLLAGCTPEEQVSTGECPAQDYAWLKGKNLAAVTIPSDLDARVIGPDTIVTQDYVPSRLNIKVNGNGVVTDLTCG